MPFISEGMFCSADSVSAAKCAVFCACFPKDWVAMSVFSTLFGGFVPALLLRFTAALADLKEGQDFFESNFYFQTHHDP